MTERESGEILWKDIPALIEKADRLRTIIPVTFLSCDFLQSDPYNHYGIDRMSYIEDCWVEKLVEIEATRHKIDMRRRWQPACGRLFENFWFAYACLTKIKAAKDAERVTV